MCKRIFSRAKWFVFGVLVTLMLSGTALMASPVMREIVFGISVSLDGDIIQFEDDMQPFIMDGRTFLPVRAIADIVGLDVDFDGDTNTVVLTTDGIVGSTASSDRPLRGTWDNNVFASEYLGLQFTLPDGWFIRTDAEIADTFGQEMAYYVDMEVVCPNTGASINIILGRLYYDMTEAEYLKLSAEGIREMLEEDFDASFQGYIRIGAYDWHYYSFEMDTGIGTILSGRQLFNIKDGFARIISIFYPTHHGVALEDILIMFNDL